MKVLCKYCENLCKKFGKIDCDDYKNTSLEELEIKRKQLLVSNENPELLKTIEDKLDYFNFGINKRL